MQPDPGTILRRTRNPQALLPRTRIATLHPLKTLHQPTHNIRSQVKRKLLSDANPWASIERQERPVKPRFQVSIWSQKSVQILFLGHLPSWPQVALYPAFRYEFISIFAVHIFSAVHREDLIAHLCAFRHENRRRAIRSTADGECGVSESFAGVAWDGRVQSEGLVDAGA